MAVQFRAAGHCHTAVVVNSESTKAADCFAEDFVRVKTPQFLDQAVLQGAAGQGDPVCGLARLGQFGDGVSGPEQPNVTRRPAGSYWVNRWHPRP